MMVDLFMGIITQFVLCGKHKKNSQSHNKDSFTLQRVWTGCYCDREVPVCFCVAHA